MAKFLKLSGLIINLEYVQQVLFVPEPPTASVVWGSGYEETIVTGEDALFLMDSIDERAIPGIGIPVPNDDLTAD